LKSILLLFALAFLCVHAFDTPKDEEHAILFRERYKFLSLKEGLVEAQAQRRPLAVFVMQPWCGACKALKRVLTVSAGIQSIATELILVKAEGGEEEKEFSAWAKDFHDDESLAGPDGGYFPRILFFAPDLQPLHITAPRGHPDYQYFYNQESQVIDAMKLALEKSEGFARPPAPPTLQEEVAKRKKQTISNGEEEWDFELDDPDRDESKVAGEGVEKNEGENEE